MLFRVAHLVLLAAVGMTNAVPGGKPGVKRDTHGGIATVNPNPNGALGSCGKDSPDSSFTVAISSYWMTQHAPGPYCGRKIILTNTGPSTDQSVGGKGNTVEVFVEDTCEGCHENHLDLSVAAWNALTNSHAYSVVSIAWDFCTIFDEC